MRETVSPQLGLAHMSDLHLSHFSEQLDFEFQWILWSELTACLTGDGSGTQLMMIALGQALSPSLCASRS